MSQQNIKMKVVETTEAAYKEINGKVIDLDLGLELLMNFNENTGPQAKNFKRLAKKFNGSDRRYQEKETLKFMKKELYNTFKNEFLDKFYTSGEYEILPKDDIAIYIFGAFVEGHATTTNIDITTQFKLLIIELTNRIYAALIEAGKKD